MIGNLNKIIVKKETKNIFITITINLVVAALIFLFLINFDLTEFIKFISSLFLNFFIGILGLYFIGYLIGQNLNKLKNKNNKYNVSHGVLAIFGVLFFGTLIGSTIGFLQEGLPDGYEYNLKEELYDYYFKPFFWIFMFGFVPTLVSGIILGYKLKTTYNI